VRRTAIEWTDFSWNPMSGCTKISAGCANCYAERIATRFAGSKGYPDGFGVTLHPQRLSEPLSEKRLPPGSKVFVCDMGDLFHKDVPLLYIAAVFSIMARRPDVTFQVLTKRPLRMLDVLCQLMGHAPLPNVMLGTSIENRAALADRLEPMAWLGSKGNQGWRTFASVEPLLGPLPKTQLMAITVRPQEWVRYFDWVIVGGESGPGARPMDLAWAREIRDWCKEAGTPFFMKQLGGVKDKGGDLLGIPEDLRIREWPK
jgi:protein gp37